MGDLRIAIIDDGVCKNELKNTLVASYTVFHGQVKSCDDNIAKFSHGTICAKIIEKYNKNVNLISLKILDERGFGSIEDLAAALLWCLSNRISIINLSNGLERYSSIESLYSTCLLLAQNGVIIVAAQSNRNIDTVPASFPFVISVQQYNFLHRGNPLMQSTIYTTGKHKLYIDGKPYITKKCNSFACAYASASIANAYGHLKCRKRLLLDKNLKLFYGGKTIGTYSLPFILSSSIIPIHKAQDILENVQGNSAPIPGLSVTILVNEPSTNSQNIEKMIKDYRRKISFIIWMGKMPVRIKHLCSRYGIRIWDISRKAFPSSKSTLSRTVPTVQMLLRDDYTNGFSIIRSLKQELQLDGYSTTVISTILSASLNGYAYSKQETLSDAIEYLYRATSPDIIIIISPVKVACSDIFFEFSNGNFFTQQDKQLFFSSAKDLKNYLYEYFG